jgi:hypothetical protein
LIAGLPIAGDAPLVRIVEADRGRFGGDAGRQPNNALDPARQRLGLRLHTGIVRFRSGAAIAVSGDVAN